MRNWNIFCSVLLVFFICSSNFSLIEAQDKIEGPWYWLIVDTSKKGGGAAVTKDDWIKEVTGGKLTEDKLAKQGITKEILKIKNKNKLKWTSGKIAPAGGNNVNDTINKIKLGNGDINNHASYAIINCVSKVAKKGASARVGSDDGVKVWFNGKDVHTNAVDRGAGDFQDNFEVDIKKGDNVLMVKVTEKGGGWSMFVGIDAKLTYNLKFAGLAVEPESKLTTSWGSVKRQRN
ncbi:MAG: hypothetical protein VX830_12450 [Candidatus Poribacteria bacterium]|nr:hypothetical protein [Candidatus Poribacteria bacterium]|tara:strand:+ start:292 stop:990 length:699 start_codon:yes stop_codon:yes gene_type:complete